MIFRIQIKWNIVCNAVALVKIHCITKVACLVYLTTLKRKMRLYFIQGLNWIPFYTFFWPLKAKSVYFYLTNNHYLKFSNMSQSSFSCNAHIKMGTRWDKFSPKALRLKLSIKCTHHSHVLNLSAVAKSFFLDKTFCC